MSETVIPVPEEWKKRAHIDAEKYAEMYRASVSDPEGFWGKFAENFQWQKPWKSVKNTRFLYDNNVIASDQRERGNPGGDAKSWIATSPAAPRNDESAIGVSIQWFEGGQLNITENCLDRHLASRGDQVAIIWEGDDPKDSRNITYRELHADVCRFANVLKKHGVKAGERVTIYLPMIPEAAVAMLACARIGAVHSVVFGGFSPEAVKGRIEDCGSRLIITADEGLRGGKKTPLKANVDEALTPTQPSPLQGESKGGGVDTVIVVRRTGGKTGWVDGRDHWYHEEMNAVDAECAPAALDAEAPLFVLYTSGSTGKPKGVLHTTAGYMVWAAATFQYVFDYHSDQSTEFGVQKEKSLNSELRTPVTPEIYWCTADVGWVTGHTYILYGPLLTGATTLMFEGVPNYPDHSRFWQVVDKHRVNTFYTAPTAIRALMREGDEWVKKTSRTSLRLLGSVGEPINPEAWLWYWRVVGEERCPVVDTWWQTETGGHMITPLPGATPLKPGSATLPFFGVQPVILDQSGNVLEGACEGLLCIADSWPGQARTVWGDHARFEQTYFSQFKGYYFTGDGAKRDADGYYWITGRVDDVLNVSGHRIGTAEVESALVSHASVAEAAVVGYPHDIKGQGIYCYVTLNADTHASEELLKDLKTHVRHEIGPIATPDIIHFTPGLPKTRSGKIMRRILRKIAEGDVSNLGDISTLLNPEIVEQLIKERKA